MDMPMRDAPQMGGVDLSSLLGGGEAGMPDAQAQAAGIQNGLRQFITQASAFAAGAPSIAEEMQAISKLAIQAQMKLQTGGDGSA